MWYTELVCLFEYWVCILCLLYFTELVVDIVDFVFLLYRWFLYAWVSCALLLGNAEGEYWKCIWEFFFLNLFVTHDIFIVYFFVIRILFCVIDRISVSLLFNWVLYLYFCPLCFVFELCIWYWKVQTWYLLLCWLRLYTNLCNWVANGVLILFVLLSRRVILFCDICVTKFPFPLFRRRICRSKVILGILKNGVLGVLSKFCILQKLDYFVLSQVYILSLVIFQWVLALTFIYFVIKFGVCYLVLLSILIFIFVLTFYLLFWYFIICVDFCLYCDICYFHFDLLFFFLTCYFCFDSLLCFVLLFLLRPVIVLFEYIIVFRIVIFALTYCCFYLSFVCLLNLCFCFCAVSATGIFTLNFAWFYAIVLKDMLVCCSLFCTLVCRSIYWLFICFQYIYTLVCCLLFFTLMCCSLFCALVCWSIYWLFTCF